MKTLRLLIRDPGVWMAVATLGIQGRAIYKLRQILANRAKFDAVIRGGYL